jgi:cytoskeletal protein RodZ
MSKIDETEAKLANAEFKVATAVADVASSQKFIVKNMSSSQKSHKNLFVIVFVALVINLVLTVSLAGAFITLNENAAKADEVAAIQAQTEQNTAVIENAQAEAELQAMEQEDATVSSSSVSSDQ